MSNNYLDVFKVVKCAEHKKSLNALSGRLKVNVIDSCNGDPHAVNSFLFSQNINNELNLEIFTYDVKIIFTEKLVVINDVPLMKYTATEPSDDHKKEIMSFFLNKNGLVFIGEYKPNPSYEYEDVSLWLEILEATLKALKGINRISY